MRKIRVQLNKDSDTEIYAPGKGQLIPLSEVPDQVFAQK